MRRGTARVVAVLVLIAGSAAVAIAQEGVTHWPGNQYAWDKIPAITTVGAEGDTRTRLVEEAMDFWNQQLAGVGTPFRLGPVTHRSETVPVEFLSRTVEALMAQKPVPEWPEVLKGMPGDIVIVLSLGNFISFSTMYRPGARVLIGIRTHLTLPFTRPNVTRNVIAHEMGHAVGLGHNNDPAKLMCGRPAPCRPDDFASPAERFFPLTDQEKAHLARLYPSTWRPTR